MADALWSWDDLNSAARPIGPPDAPPKTAITGFSIDTRTLQIGDVFVALKDQRDGHEFVAAAFERGASAALVERGYQRKPGHGALIVVEDTLAALGRIGVAARNRLSSGARVIAVTGSAGKTGTKEMLRACLATAGKVHAPDKSFNNHWGVPLTLARMPADTEFGVFEIGMNHSGEIRPLARMVRPHVAIITNVLPVHIGNFPDGEIGIAEAKAEIFEGLEPGGVAIVPKDNPHFERLCHRARAANAKILSFGSQAGSDLRLVASGSRNAADAALQWVEVETAASGKKFTTELGMLGDHLARNALAVFAAIDVLGLSPQPARNALAEVRSMPGRGERMILRTSSGGEILLVDESYNANPASMEAALRNLAELDGRRIAVLGDMLELGPRSGDFHKTLKGATDRVDLVFACGPNMKLLFESLPEERRGGWAPTSEGLIASILNELRDGDVVMVKGSLGSRMAPIVDAIKKRFAAGGGSV